MRMFAITLITLAAIAAQPAGAHDGKEHETDATKQAIEVAVEEPKPGVDEKARRYFTDLPVVTQDGESLRFYSDVLKGRIVVVTLFFSNCTGSCPLNNQKLAEMQDILGDALGRDYFFVSVSLDPERDTPDVLKKYSQSFGAKDGWLFLTGDIDDLNTITRRLGQTTPDFEAHSPFFMLGNVPSAHWARMPPFAPPEAIVARLRVMSDDGATN